MVLPISVNVLLYSLLPLLLSSSGVVHAAPNATSKTTTATCGAIWKAHADYFGRRLPSYLMKARWS